MQLVLGSCSDDNSIERALIDQVRMDPALGDRELGHPRLQCQEHALLTSAWQKAIRRGDADLASSCALVLHRQDPGYVWRRIRGIALEEISVADPQLVATVLAMAGKKRLREQLGDRALLSLLTQRLSAAPKARTACDLLVWANHEPAADTVQHAMPGGRDGRPELLDWRAARRVQLIAGLSRRVRGRWECIARARPLERDQWLELIGAPPLVRYIACRGGGTDALNLLLVLVWQVYGSTGDELLRPYLGIKDGAEEHIGGVPAFAWCLYSAPGREALRVFLATRDPLAVAIRRLCLRDPVAALGHLVFHSQGSFCRRVWAVPGYWRIRRAGEMASLRDAGVPLSAASGLEHALGCAWPALNRSRRDVALRHGWLH